MVAVMEDATHYHGQKSWVTLKWLYKSSSRMKGNFQVRFHEEWLPVMGATYSPELSSAQQNPHS